MNDTEKIEAIRKVLYGYGMLSEKLEQVRDIIDPKPPKWVEYVNKADRPVYEDVPLVWVLHDLAGLAGRKSAFPQERLLARIIAVADQQAEQDTDCYRTKQEHIDGQEHCDLDCLFDALSVNDAVDWVLLADRAVNWLQCLTGEQEWRT